MSWQLLASHDALLKRSDLYKTIRKFFENKQVLEVETPLLSYAGVTDPFINSFEVYEPNDTTHQNKYYLQTSPEYAMKRMLCSGVGSIFQICKAFRCEEIGAMHHVEFSILEWYRINFDLQDLMNEMAELLCLVLNLENNASNIIFISYQQLFLEYLNFDYNLVDITFLKKLIKKIFDDSFDSIIDHHDFDNLYDKDDLLMILLSNYIEPKMAEVAKNKILFLYNYPASQAALAKLELVDGYRIAKRFEVYFNGVELANGFQELSDPAEQEARFQKDLEHRKKLGLPMVNIDHNFLAGLKHGLPECSGVALGLDRLLMQQMSFSNIEEVLAFRF